MAIASVYAPVDVLRSMDENTPEVDEYYVGLDKLMRKTLNSYAFLIAGDHN